MPELPDVEVYRKKMSKCVKGGKIKKAEVRDERAVKGPKTKKALAKLKGKSVEKIIRRGKNLFLKFTGGGWFAFHFGMTGAVECFSGKEKEPPYTKALFSFDSGKKLSYILKRMLGKIEAIDSPEEYIKKKKIGPDALRAGYEAFKRGGENYTGGAKNFLMSQDKISGIGNIYSDEILFQSKVHPAAKMSTLKGGGLKKLYRNTEKVLKEAIKKGAEPRKLPRTWLLTNRKKNGKCPKCGGAVKKIKAGGRSAYYCASCQKK